MASGIASLWFEVVIGAASTYGGAGPYFSAASGPGARPGGHTLRAWTLIANAPRSPATAAREGAKLKLRGERAKSGYIRPAR
jgi:hypothetical protein